MNIIKLLNDLESKLKEFEDSVDKHTHDFDNGYNLGVKYTLQTVISKLKLIIENDVF